MTFQNLLDGVEFLFQQGEASIVGLDYDSRRVQPGFMFVAMKGESTDGNRYIDQAIAKGAVAVVTDSRAEQPRPNVAWAQVSHGRRALARLSANFYKRTAEKLAITGITGTNGKTTTSFIVEAVLRACGRKNALVGTIEYHVGDEVIPAPHTTPEPLELNQLFARAHADGATEAVMEVSSHALAQQRVYGIPFDVAVFSNLTRDHLDFHGTFDEYFAAKKVLFEGCGTAAPRVAVLNSDDDYGAQLVSFCKKQGSQVFTYGITKGDFHAEKLEISAAGNRFDLMTPDGPVAIWSPLIGKVNVYNVLAASAAAFARGCSRDVIAKGIVTMERVPGRFEKVDEGQGFAVVVDYAHTDDALKNLTALGRDFVSRSSTKGRVITVFGCGGDRDRTKRPLMGEAAGRGSDYVVLTSDNPRSEDPLAIMNDSIMGLQRTGISYALEPDRRKAIAHALQQANTGDIVLIAGKGHEKTQTTREGVFPFDDLEVAREELRKLGYNKEQSGRQKGPR